MAVEIRIIVAVVFAIIAASCGDGGSRALTSPTPTLTSPTAPAVFGVSGTVSEVTSTGLAPLAGAQVDASGHSATTNAQGFYAFSGLATQPRSVTVSKPGYKAETRAVNVPSTVSNVVVNVELVRESDIHALFGIIVERTATGFTVPAEGVLVEAMSCTAISRGCGSSIVQRATTDQNGAYRLQGMSAGPNNFIWVSKAGYDVIGLPETSNCDNCNAIVTLNDDTRLDIQIVRR